MTELAWPSVAVLALAVVYRLGMRLTSSVESAARLRSFSVRLESLEASRSEMDDALEAARETVLKLADHEDRIGALQMRAGMDVS